ncbi:hypothetical protein BGZ65_011216, partial [Modicella reniformis]
DNTTGNTVAYIKQEKSGKDPQVHHVSIPGESNYNIRSTFLYCARSIHLLAAAYSYSRREAKRTSRDSSQETLSFEEHAEAIIRFTLGHINRLLSKRDYSALRLTREPGKATLKWTRSNTARTLIIGEDSNQRGSVVTVLALLLARQDLNDVNHVFVEGLLSSDNCRWVPHTGVASRTDMPPPINKAPNTNKALHSNMASHTNMVTYTDMALNPIARAINMKDVKLLKILIDYCLKCAKTYHPAYLAPVEQCLAELLKHYPDIVANVFRATSYIPAHNHAYLASNAVRSSGKFWNLTHKAIRVIPFGKIFNRIIPRPFGLGDNNNAVFTLRSELPVVTPSKTSFIKRDVNLWFPKMPDEPHPHKNRSYTIYVSPLQFRPIKIEGRSGERYESVFTHITRRDFLNNPAVEATLRFTW